MKVDDRGARVVKNAGNSGGGALAEQSPACQRWFGRHKRLHR
jgi:hypothetical protein